MQCRSIVKSLATQANRELTRPECQAVTGKTDKLGRTVAEGFRTSCRVFPLQTFSIVLHVIKVKGSDSRLSGKSKINFGD